MDGLIIYVLMEMFCRILADSVNSYNDRITTFLVYLPHAYLFDFYKSGIINISYKLLNERKYIPTFCKETMNNYYWKSALDFLSNLPKQTVINMSISYTACIMTSTKWNVFFNMLYNNYNNESLYYEDDYLEFLTYMEELYINNAKNTKHLKENEWHLMKNISSSEMPLKDILKIQFAMYYKLNVSNEFNLDISECRLLFAKNIVPQYASIYNHIAKVPIEYNYLTNGLFDIKWSSKTNKLEKGYNSMYDSYLCLYDIVEELKLKL